MTEYASLKVPELKKLLQEKALATTGNKADLIARLQENDRKTSQSDQAAEDEIDYSDDDELKAKTSSKPDAKPAATAATVETADPAVESASESPAAAAPITTASAVDKEVAPAQGTNVAENPSAAPEASKEDFALNIPATSGEEEARKRAERAKRFGIIEGDETKKQAERAKRFGIDSSSLATGLDTALPEQPRKRGRDRGDKGDDRDGRDSKRKFTERNGVRKGGRGGRNQPQGRRTGGQGGQGGGKGGRRTTGVIGDPVEKAKADARAKRFATSS